MSFNENCLTSQNKVLDVPWKSNLCLLTNNRWGKDRQIIQSETMAVQQKRLLKVLFLFYIPIEHGKAVRVTQEEKQLLGLRWINQISLGVLE